MRIIYLLPAFLFIITPATAMDSIFDITSETAYNDSLDIVTVFPEPDKIVQEHEHIRGWIDIVGFNHTVNLNGVQYCNQSDPVIKYNLWAEGITSKKRITNNKVDFIKVIDERTFKDGDGITTKIDVHLKWHHSVRKSRTVDGRTRTWIKKTYHHEYMTLSAHAKAPQQLISAPMPSANITIYNNSVNPYVEIYVPVFNTTTKTVYSYGDETITRRTLSGIACTGAVNFSDCLYWEDKSDIWAYKNNVAVLKGVNESKFDQSILSITVHSPYEVQQINNVNVSSVEMNPNKPFSNPNVFVTLILLVVFGWGIKKSMAVCGDLI